MTVSSLTALRDFRLAKVTPLHFTEAEYKRASYFRKESTFQVDVLWDGNLDQHSKSYPRSGEMAQSVSIFFHISDHGPSTRQ